MAAGAILEVGDTLLAMLTFDFARVMLVAGVAIVSSQISRVADLTGVHPALAMIERESMRLVEEGGQPAGCIVTVGTLNAE